MAGSPPEGRPRVFFALWPSRAEALEMQRFAATLALQGGRRMRAETLHLTLAFIGAVAAGEIEGLCAIGRRQRLPALELRFDETGWWPHNQVLWTGCRDAGEALSRLVADLAVDLNDAGYALERRPFKAHVTLARKVRHAEVLPPVGLVWRRPAVVLVRSQLSAAGAGYRVIERFTGPY